MDELILNYRQTHAEEPVEEMNRIPENKRNNVRYLRHHLGLTQKDFISQFLTDDSGKAAMSIATLSNLEAKGGVRLDEVILASADALGIDVLLFTEEPERFAERLDLVLDDQKEPVPAQGDTSKKGNIKQLLDRMTMYFAGQFLEKKLRRGDKIESDRTLAEKFGVGRSAVREALKVLDVLGMIDIRPGQGTFISNSEAGFFIIPLSWSIFLNGDQIDEILELRDMLELKAAELAAKSDDEKAREHLNDVTGRIRDAYMNNDAKVLLNNDVEFHLCIAECSGNAVIYTMIQTISNLMRQVSATGMVTEEQMKAIYEEHQLIYGAILSRDSEGAVRYMKEHLDNSKNRYQYR